MQSSRLVCDGKEWGPGSFFGSEDGVTGSSEKSYRAKSSTWHLLHVPQNLSSFFCFAGPPPEFCKSENPEKEKKEGLL